MEKLGDEGKFCAPQEGEGVHTIPEVGIVSLGSQGRAGSLIHLATFAEPLPGAGD